MTLLYFSPVPWNSFSQRPHFFVRWYQQRFGGEVVWINPYPSRFLKFRDIRSLVKPRDDWQSDCPSWLHVIQPRLLPIEPIKKLAWINRLIWKSQSKYCGVSALLERHSSILKLVVGKPSDIALATATRCPPDSCLCDVMDDFSAFHSGIASKRLSDVELALLTYAGTVWTSSSGLFEKFSRIHGNTIWVANGLEAAAFKMVSPIHSEEGANPVAGYVGTIGTWFDWDWISLLARALPEYSIHLVGPLHVTVPSNLPLNIHIFTALPHSEAIDLMRSFKLALIPFKINQLTQCVDPIKYYEYKALGLPVISTNFGEMQLHQKSGGVFICHDERTMKQAIEMATTYHSPKEHAVEFMKNNSWHARFDAAALKMTRWLASDELSNNF